MNTDDPFADFSVDQVDQTVVGGGLESPTPQDLPQDVHAPVLVGVNPLARLAAPLFDLIVRVRDVPSYEDVAGLRTRTVQEIRRFEKASMDTGLSLNALRAARYALCATIDDVVLNTPWGSHGQWAAQSMVSLFHNEVSGGERFFIILARLEKQPAAYVDVIELMYLCLSLGFAGKYRVDARGSERLVHIRAHIYQLLRQWRGDQEQELSPNWKGVRAATRRAFRVPGWIVWAACALGLGFIYIGLSFLLSSITMQTSTVASQIAPATPITLVRSAPVLTPEPQYRAYKPQIEAFIPAEVARGQVEVLEDAQAVTIRLISANLFASGTGQLTAQYVPLIGKISQALDRYPGQIIIGGHTDNVPIRTVRFPSNWELSQARAQSVAQLMKAALRMPARVEARGRADVDPIASNQTPEGRARNRRIEIILTKVDS
ncbi:MAG: type IVB secretion system protein IcmH/DotU [Pseudomonadota bacterium]